MDDDERGEREGLGAPENERSGETVAEAVASAEAGSQVDGEHTPSAERGASEPGDSRLEQLTRVEQRNVSDPGHATRPGIVEEDLPTGPSPADIGSGGAQRIEGARISDRVSAGEDVPDGPPFDSAENPAE